MARRAEGAGTVRRALERRAQHGVAELLDEVVQVREIELDRIIPNPRQPRRHIDSKGIEQLARSIEAHGLLQPIVVRPSPGGSADFELVAGSRRLRAVGSLGRPSITALVLKEGDAETLALIENLQRADLDPVDEAEALVALKDSRGLTLEAMQQLVGKSISYLSEIMSLLRLPPEILGEARALAAEGRPVPRASLIELARMKDEEARLAAWRGIRVGSSRRAEVRVRRQEAAADSSGGDHKGRRLASEAANVVRRIDSLSELLARVRAADAAGEDQGWWQRQEVQRALEGLRDRINRLLEG